MQATGRFPQRVVVYDPGFVQRFGHHYTYNSLLRDALSGSGRESVLLCSGMLPDDVALEFPGCVKELRTPFYEGATAEPPMERLRRRALGHARDLFSAAAAAAGGDALLFAHTLDPSALLGVALWHDSLPAAAHPAMVLNVMLGAGGEREYRDSLAPAAKLLAGVDRAALFGGTPALARLLGELTGKDCRMLPTPLPQALDGPHEKSGEIRYGVYGDARTGKNLHILPEAIRRYLGQGGRGSFTVSVTPTDAGLTDALVALHELGRAFPNRVRVGFRHLGVAEYYEAMRSATALIVPYCYDRFRPSGLVIESAAAGTPLVGLAGGFMEEELAGLDNGSLFFARATPALLSRALLRFDREHAERGAKARMAAKRYAARQGMDALLRCLG